MSCEYVLDGGVYRPTGGVAHHDEHYDPANFAVLRQMQLRHCWYRGRRRFLHHALRRTLQKTGQKLADLRCIDLGGGCGGWGDYLLQTDSPPRELALGDSSDLALENVSELVRARADRYQLDLLNLGWESRWDLAFLLDVLEHIPSDADMLRQIHAALAPGGLLFVITPALQQFWTYNDDLVQHVRRYSRADMRRLADECGFELLDARYFMFLTSPLLLASRRLRRVNLQEMSAAERQQLLEQTHRVPPTWLNTALTALLAMETPLGHAIPFPWGTSLLAVLRKPV